MVAWVGPSSACPSAPSQGYPFPSFFQPRPPLHCPSIPCPPITTHNSQAPPPPLTPPLSHPPPPPWSLVVAAEGGTCARTRARTRSHAWPGHL